MKKGIYLSIITAVISGVSIFANAMFVSRADPFIFTIIRNGVVALLLTVLLVTLGKFNKLTSLSRHDWVKLLVIGAVGGGIPFALFFTGITQIGALNGNIIQKTLFLWVAIIAVPMLHERLTRVQLVGYATLFLGMFVFGGTFSVLPKTGTWLVLAATVLWAVENVIAKVTLKNVHPVIVSWGRMVFGLPFLLAAIGVTGKFGLLFHPAAYGVTPILVSSVLLILYVITWYHALAKAPATMVSSVLVFAPVVTAVLTGMILKKSVLPQQIGNLILLTTGTILVVLGRPVTQKRISSV